jgi:hypothetical protein
MADGESQDTVLLGGRDGRSSNRITLARRRERGEDGGPRVIVAACRQQRASLPSKLLTQRRSTAKTITGHAEGC